MAAQAAAPAATEQEPEHEAVAEEHHEHVEEQDEHVEEPEPLESYLEQHVGLEESHGQESSESTLIDEPESVSTGLTQEHGVHEVAEETAAAILNAKQEDLEAEATEIVHAAQAGEGDPAAEDKVKPDTTETYEEGHEELPTATEEPEPVAESEEAEHEDEHEETTPAEKDAQPEEHDVPVESEAVNLHDAEHEHEPGVEIAHDDAAAENASYVNGKTTPTPAGRNGTDLEDIVNMLEAKPMRPISIVSIPDEVMEIPDED